MGFQDAVHSDNAQGAKVHGKLNSLILMQANKNVVVLPLKMKVLTSRDHMLFNKMIDMHLKGHGWWSCVCGFQSSCHGSSMCNLLSLCMLPDS